MEGLEVKPCFEKARNFSDEPRLCQLSNRCEERLKIQVNKVAAKSSTNRVIYEPVSRVLL
jgi:hypothetical protein